MLVSVDENSGFCWGVVRAVDYAEKELNASGKLYCLGEIIHNPIEIERLKKLGLETITIDDLPKVKDAKVLIRAHGEPPSTYELAKANNIELIDATCPIVTKVQDRIQSFHEKGYQIIIFGKREHPEVIGLNGVCVNSAIIIKTEEEAKAVKLFKMNVIFSQTTMDKTKFKNIVDIITERAKNSGDIVEIEVLVKDTICRSVSDREAQLIEFSKKNDVVLFVSGKNSSNGKVLFEICKSTNTETYFIEKAEEIESLWMQNKKSVGITGATSTPKWVMEEVKEYIISKNFNLKTAI
jgi:4-hydroxy-3-methylbut-2-en-1-yl diphosphate reductase